MARRMYDLDNGTESIKVKSLDTSKITSGGKNALRYDSINDRLNIGVTSFNVTNISGKDVFLYTDTHGGIRLEALGMLLSTATNTFIKCDSALKLKNYTTALRPSNPVEGLIIYDSTLKKCILYNGTAWVNLDGTALS